MWDCASRNHINEACQANNMPGLFACDGGLSIWWEFLRKDVGRLHDCESEPELGSAAHRLAAEEEFHGLSGHWRNWKSVCFSRQVATAGGLKGTLRPTLGAAEARARAGWRALVEAPMSFAANLTKIVAGRMERSYCKKCSILFQHFFTLFPQTGLPVRGSYSFERGASSGHMILHLSPGLFPAWSMIWMLCPHDFTSSPTCPACLPLVFH